MRDVQGRECIQRVPTIASESTALEGRDGSPMKQTTQTAANMEELQAQRDALLEWSCDVDDDLEYALFKGVHSEEEMKAIAAKNAGKIEGQVAALDAEKKCLEETCQALQVTADTTRKANAMLKMKTTIAMGSMKLSIDSLKEDKQFLTEKCEIFERKILELRLENASKQNRIDNLEYEVRGVQNQGTRDQNEI
jgi:hypothetical protein